MQVPSAEPENGGFYSYEGSNIMLPAPWLQDTVLNADTQRPFKLIPIVLTATKSYNHAHNTVGGGRAIYMPTTSVLGPGEQELEELRIQSLKLMQTMRNWRLPILPIIANALPDYLTTLATNRQDLVEHIRTTPTTHHEHCPSNGKSSNIQPVAQEQN